MEDNRNDTPPQPMPSGQSSDSIGWLTSLFVHLGIFIALTLITLPEIPSALGPLLEVETVSLEDIDDSLDIEDISVEISSDLTDAISLDSVLVEAPLEPIENSFDTAPSAPEPVSLTSEAMSASIFSTSSGVAGEGVDGRTAAGKSSLVASKGGSKASEVAVARGLQWIAEHQNRDGTWSLVHTLGPCRGRCNHPAVINKRTAEQAFEETRISGTALALLPFLGAGQTHLSGKHKDIIARGLRALVLLGKEPKGEAAKGIEWIDSGRLYAHGLAAIVLTEAYGLTKDPDLLAPAQSAIDFVAYAQDPQGGGWRYRVHQVGDTSATGWQIMALKSAQLAELKVPKKVIPRAASFFDSVQSKNGERYRYLLINKDGKPGKPTTTLTAVGLLCRMYMGWEKDDARLLRGAEYLAKNGPSESNFYYNYYAAQTIFHATGGEGALWRSWNEPMREQLIDQQETRGHLRGSWWIPGPHNERGGRLYMTSLATMTLEVYYRYLPLFKSAAVSTEFPD